MKSIKKLQPAEFWMGLVFLFGVIEGALRKWFLPASPALLGYLSYLSKDIFFAGLCLFSSPYYQGPLIKSYRKVLWLSVVFIMAGATLSTVFGINLAGAFLDVRSMIILPILSYLAASHLTNVDIQKIARWIAWLSFVPAILGVMQFMLPPTHILNRYVDPHCPVIMYKSWVRATGTFAFISGMHPMAILAVWAGMFLYTTSQTKADFFLGLAALSAGLICASTAVIRSGFFMSLGLIFIVVVIDRSRRNWIVLLLVFLAFGGLGIRQEWEEEIDQLYAIRTVVLQRHAESDSFSDRSSSIIDSLWTAINQTPCGYGFGFGQVGGAAFATGQRQFLRHEHEWARIVTEVSVIGLFGILLLRIWIVYTLVAVWMCLPHGKDRSGLLVCIMAILIFLTFNNSFDHVNSGFSWPLIALSMAWATQSLTKLQQ